MSAFIATSLLWFDYSQVLCKNVLAELPQYGAVREFFQLLITDNMKRHCGTARVDFLACSILQPEEADLIVKHLQTVAAVRTCKHYIMSTKQV
jgi:hypothetical protein